VPRKTRHDYDAPGSFARLLEAALAMADCDSEDDRAFDAARMRLRVAALAYAARCRGEAPATVGGQVPQGDGGYAASV
jgi:hypothetical protein